MRVELRDYLTRDVVHQVVVPDPDSHPVLAAVEHAARDRGDLRRLDLRGADLRGACLRLANLRSAILAGADLREADLSGAEPGFANLRDADLRGARLRAANLGFAGLSGAHLDGADLRDVGLHGASGTPESLRSSAVRDDRWLAPRTAHEQRAAEIRAAFPEVPAIAGLDAEILAAIQGGRVLLRMEDWCGAPGSDDVAAIPCLCRAGIAVHLAGPAGQALERRLGPEQAGRLVYLVSTGCVPDFRARDDQALASIWRDARAGEP